MKLEIVKISTKETFQYAELKIQIWKDCYKHILPNTYLNNVSAEHKSSKYKNELLTDSTVAYYFIKMSSTPIGVLRLKYYETPAKQKCVCIKDLYFHPQYQNKGYGGIVFDFIKNEAIKNNCQFITAYIFEKNQPTRAIVAKLGFKETTNKYIHDKTMAMAIEYCLNLNKRPKLLIS